MTFVGKPTVLLTSLYRLVSSCHFRLELITCGRGTGPSQKRLGPRPELLQNSQVSRTVRGVTSAKTADVTPPSRPMLSVPTFSY